MKAPPPAEPHYNLAILGPPSTPCQTPGSEGERGAMNIDATTSQLAAHGVAFAPAIAGAAKRHNVDPTLLAAVAAQETGGPGSNAGRNVVGDGGHGHGLFQIDDRWHDFAKDAGRDGPRRQRRLRGGDAPRADRQVRRQRPSRRFRPTMAEARTRPAPQRPGATAKPSATPTR